jgi:hypothetical protein
MLDYDNTALSDTILPSLRVTSNATGKFLFGVGHLAQTH